MVRHGEVHNPGGIIYGRLPRVALSPRGWEQARRVADLLAARPLAAVYSSPLLRARQTARAVAARHPGVPLRTSRLLNEVRSSWQGHRREEVLHEPLRFNYYMPPRQPGDETLAQLFERMHRFVRRVLKRHPGQTVVAVSHGDPLVALRVGLEGRPLTLEEVRGPRYPPLGSVFELIYRDGHLVKVDPL